MFDIPNIPKWHNDLVVGGYHYNVKQRAYQLLVEDRANYYIDLAGAKKPYNRRKGIDVIVAVTAAENPVIASLPAPLELASCFRHYVGGIHS